MNRHERAAANRAKQDVPCQPECQDSWCVCDEQTRHQRLLRFAHHLKGEINSLVRENVRVREQRDYFRAELNELVSLGEGGGR